MTRKGDLKQLEMIFLRFISSTAWNLLYSCAYPHNYRWILEGDIAKTDLIYIIFLLDCMNKCTISYLRGVAYIMITQFKNHQTLNYFDL